MRLGAGDRVVGVSGYTVRPPEAREKPKVSAFLNARLDKIEALRPDLILAFSDLQAGIVDGEKVETQGRIEHFGAQAVSFHLFYARVGVPAAGMLLAGDPFFGDRGDTATRDHAGRAVDVASAILGTTGGQADDHRGTVVIAAGHRLPHRLPHRLRQQVQIPLDPGLQRWSRNRKFVPP